MPNKQRNKKKQPNKTNKQTKKTKKQPNKKKTTHHPESTWRLDKGIHMKIKH